jgi:phospholipid/cholesterol/gamma-HCH transport system permease protein
MPAQTASALIHPIVQLGGAMNRRIAHFGIFVRFAGGALRGLGSVRSWAKWSRLGQQIYFVGTTSAPVLALVGAFIGMILAIEGYPQFAAIGQEGRLGGVINVSVVKQIGPVLAAVMLAGRVGCSLTAELGSMRVTEQLDAMRAMAADPVRVLVCPRVVACVVTIPLLTVISNLCGVIGGWMVTTKFYTADPVQYWRFTEVFVSWYSVFNGLCKSVFFGLAIGLISCYKGFHCKPGAEGVGRATTESFVMSFIAIIIINLVLAKVLNDIDILRNKGNLTTLFG